MQCYKSAPYAAKPQIGDGTHYITATIDDMKYLVQDMEKQQSIEGRTTSTDRLYTSIESENWLLSQDIKTAETLKKGRQGIPSELFDTKDRYEFSATCYFENIDMNLVQYVILKKIKKISTLLHIQPKASQGAKKTLLYYQHFVLYMGKRSMMVRSNRF